MRGSQSGQHNQVQQARAVVALLAFLLVTSCGGTQGTSATKTTSAKQVASVVAKDEVPILAAISYEDNCLAGSVSMECMFAVNVLARYEKIAALNTTLASDLKAVQPVDPEVAKLTDQTISLAQQVGSTWSTFSTCAHRTGSTTACGDEWGANERAWRAVKSEFDAWKPYTG
jgi:hypothetical protein